MNNKNYTLEELRDYNRQDVDSMLDWCADKIEQLREEFKNERTHVVYLTGLCDELRRVIEQARIMDPQLIEGIEQRLEKDKQ